MSISGRTAVLTATLVIAVAALLWAGSGDRAARLQAELGIDDVNEPLHYFRTRIVLASRLAGLAAPIDGVCTALDDATALDAELTAALAPVADKGFVTFHAAYGYFTAHFGLRNAGFLALGDASAPGAAKLQELQGQLRAGDFDFVGEDRT